MTVTDTANDADEAPASTCEFLDTQHQASANLVSDPSGCSIRAWTFDDRAADFER